MNIVLDILNTLYKSVKKISNVPIISNNVNNK